MIMQYRDRDRLLLSVFLATILFILLFLCLHYLPWADLLHPFPESTPLLVFEIETDTLQGEPTELLQVPEAPVISPPATTPLEESRPSVSTTSRAERGSQPQGKPAPSYEPVPPSLERSPYLSNMSQETPPPIPRRIEPFTPSSGPDPRAAEMEFLRSEKARLESWLKENTGPATVPPTTVPVEEKRGEAVPPGPIDPTVQRITEELAAVSRRLEQLSAASPETNKSPSDRETNAASLLPIYDAEGKEVGKGELKGRVPLTELKIGKIVPEDFEGFPLQDVDLRAEFIINESGLIEPGSLKISGDTRYTRVVEKVRSALAAWRFDSRPGVRTLGVLTFTIKVRGM
jgi:hypothetical protein